MQHDEMIWQVINHQFCSYKTGIGKAKSDKTLFCKHPYSVTGLCNRTSCPLANSKYATLREENGKVYLCMKTPERAHSPKNLWEKILLSRNYTRALEQIDEHLQHHFSKTLVHRNKQRLTKIHQYLLRMRKIKLKQLRGEKASMVRVHRKVEQREERREQKALVAAKLTKNIEKELLQRLAKGTYGDLYNVDENQVYEKVLQEQEQEEEMEDEESEEEEGLVEYVEDLEEEEDEEDDVEDLEYLGDGQWGSASSESEEEDEESSEEDDDEESDDESSSSSSSEDEEEDGKQTKPKKKKRDTRRRPRGTRVEIEYEQEEEETATVEMQEQQQQDAVAGMAW